MQGSLSRLCIITNDALKVKKRIRLTLQSVCFPTLPPAESFLSKSELFELHWHGISLPNQMFLWRGEASFLTTALFQKICCIPTLLRKSHHPPPPDRWGIVSWLTNTGDNSERPFRRFCGCSWHIFYATATFCASRQSVFSYCYWWQRRL